MHLEKLKAPSGRKTDDAPVSALYNIMQSIENKLGGGEGIEGIYGSVTQTGMQKIYDSFRINCNFGSSSTLVDIGAGLGRPLLHAMVQPGSKPGIGYEIDHVKVAKAKAFLFQSIAEMQRRELLPEGVQLPRVVCSSIEKVQSLDGCTHAFSFWEGVPFSGKEAFGRLFAASKTMRAVAVVQRAIRQQKPEELMFELGFGPVMLISSFVVKMCGSGRSFTAYVFSKANERSINYLHSLRSPGSHVLLDYESGESFDSTLTEAQPNKAPTLEAGYKHLDGTCSPSDCSSATAEFTLPGDPSLSKTGSRSQTGELKERTAALSEESTLSVAIPPTPGVAKDQESPTKKTKLDSPRECNHDTTVPPVPKGKGARHAKALGAKMKQQLKQEQACTENPSARPEPFPTQPPTPYINQHQVTRASIKQEPISHQITIKQESVTDESSVHPLHIKQEPVTASYDGLQVAVKHEVPAVASAKAWVKQEPSEDVVSYDLETTGTQPPRRSARTAQAKAAKEAAC